MLIEQRRSHICFRLRACMCGVCYCYALLSLRSVRASARRCFIKCQSPFLCVRRKRKRKQR